MIDYCYAVDQDEFVWYVPEKKEEAAWEVVIGEWVSG